ncbi:MAG: hypothetical protein JWP26_2835 [Devosia sp.]|uniref:hypothetical protein n=1 Tax=Devosia sp. TaxID=1871048 RepID=UPI0026354846|nr:hypothetical protein [Devosia sp.]MDB5587865.1 hypothetical protein [Devosia sp.]
MVQDLKLRLGGLASIAIGVAVGWFFLWLPLQEAQSGAPEVSYQLKAFILVPLCIIFGVGFVVAGERLQYRNAQHSNLTVTGWVLFIVAAALTAAGYFWFQQQFAALGYV